jgi:hypothetical protein
MYMGPLLIYKDENKVILDYDGLMHVRRFTKLPKLFMNMMPEAKAIHYSCYCIYVKEYMPDKEDFPDFEIKYSYTPVNEATVDLLKTMTFPVPTILVVNYEE